MNRLHVTETDLLYCSECLAELREGDPMDLDPNLWTHANIDWDGKRSCESCGETGEFAEL